MSDETALFARCARIPTAIWSDTLDRFGIQGIIDGLTWRCGPARVAGPAVTVREEVRPFGELPFEAFDVGRILRSATSAAILVIGMEGPTAVSTFGGLAAVAAAKRRLAGVVIDGGCRDIEEVRRTGVALASRHITPRSGKQRVRVAEVGGWVTCGGVMVAPGDAVVADETGVVAIPRDRLTLLLPAAEELASRDAQFQAALEAGAEFGDIAARLRHL